MTPGGPASRSAPAEPAPTTRDRTASVARAVVVGWVVLWGVQRLAAIPLDDAAASTLYQVMGRVALVPSVILLALVLASWRGLSSGRTPALVPGLAAFFVGLVDAYYWSWPAAAASLTAAAACLVAARLAASRRRRAA